MSLEVKNNTLFGILYNNFDWLIRFTYCRVPVVRDILQKLMFKKLYTSNIQRLDEAFEEIKTHLEKADFEIKGKTVLEPGPGNSYAMAFNFLQSGAMKAILVDKFPRQFNTDYQREFLKKETDFFEKKYNKTLNYHR